MKLEEIKKDIFYVGAPDAERRLFDELVPLPQGTSYNAYLIRGRNKTALLDSVDPSKEKELVDNLCQLGLKSLDYIVAHHCEQDHSGSIPTILALYPEAKVVTNEKCKAMLIDHLRMPEDKFIVIGDGEKLELGGETLQFILTPWVHWPETMCSYLAEERILFSCDFFAAHIGQGGIHNRDEEAVYLAAKRYFAEIMMPFRTAIRANLAKLEPYKIDLIAPSHGPLYERPALIIDAYKDWASDAVKNEVVIPYVSMHGSTAKMVNYLVEALEKKGITAKPIDLPKMDLGELAISLVDAATMVIGTPTVLTGPHPLAMYAAHLFNALRPKARFVSIIGSYGWGGKAVDQLKSLLTSFRGEVIEPVVIKGFPGPAEFAQLDILAESIYNKHLEAKLL